MERMKFENTHNVLRREYPQRERREIHTSHISRFVEKMRKSSIRIRMCESMMSTTLTRAHNATQLDTLWLTMTNWQGNKMLADIIGTNNVRTKQKLTQKWCVGWSWWASSKPASSGGWTKKTLNLVKRWREWEREKHVEECGHKKGNTDESWQTGGRHISPQLLTMLVFSSPTRSVLFFETQISRAGR